MRRFGCLAALCLLVACKGGDKDAAKTKTIDVEKRCAQLAKACGDSETHVAKIEHDCKVGTKPGCEEKATAAYDCFEKELCGKADKVWALEDFGVLSERHSKCVAERKAAQECGAK